MFQNNPVNALSIFAHWVLMILKFSDDTANDATNQATLIEISTTQQALLF